MMRRHTNSLATIYAMVRLWLYSNDNITFILFETKYHTLVLYIVIESTHRTEYYLKIRRSRYHKIIHIIATVFSNQQKIAFGKLVLCDLAHFFLSLLCVCVRVFGLNLQRICLGVNMPLYHTIDRLKDKQFSISNVVLHV